MSQPSNQPDRPHNLAGFRDYDTDDGEEYWKVTFGHAMGGVFREMESWPETRLLNHSTGEIKEGKLMNLISSIAEGVSAGHDIRLEPLGDRLRLGGYWTVIQGVAPPGSEMKGTLLIQNELGEEAHILWPFKVPIPRYVRPVLGSDGDWVASEGP